MKMSFILPVVASLALAIPALAQTSPTPATQEPEMQGQSDRDICGEAYEGEDKGHKKMAKGKHAKAKPAAPADDRSCPAVKPGRTGLNVNERAIGLAFAPHPSIGKPRGNSLGQL